MHYRVIVVVSCLVLFQCFGYWEKYAVNARVLPKKGRGEAMAGEKDNPMFNKNPFCLCLLFASFSVTNTTSQQQSGLCVLCENRHAVQYKFSTSSSGYFLFLIRSDPLIGYADRRVELSSMSPLPLLTCCQSVHTKIWQQHPRIEWLLHFFPSTTTRRGRSFLYHFKRFTHTQILLLLLQLTTRLLP